MLRSLQRTNDVGGDIMVSKTAIEETVPNIDNVEAGNIVYTCPEHGKETYFKIKALEQQIKMRDYVYVWFKHKNHSEKMWVRIKKGSRLKGEGTLDNQPKILIKMKIGDHVKFKTDVEGITWGR